MSSRSMEMLRQACKDTVVIKFWNPHDECWTHGYVLDIGPRFVLLALIGDGIRFNGFQCVRLTDVKRLQVPDPYADFAVAALRKRGEEIRKKPEIDLSNLAALLMSANRSFPLITIHRELVKPGCCYIGRVLKVTDKNLHLQEIGPDAIWDKKPSSFRLSEITRVEFGGGYEEALDLVGGPPQKLQKKRKTK